MLLDVSDWETAIWTSIMGFQKEISSAWTCHQFLSKALDTNTNSGRLTASLTLYRIIENLLMTSGWKTSLIS